MRASFKLLLLVTPLFLASACGPPWTVIRQGNPNPMNQQSKFAVDNTTFDNLSVGNKPEAVYLSAKTPEQQTGFANDKGAFNAGLVSGLQERRGPLDIAGPEALAGRFAVHSNVDFLEPGNFNGFMNFATQMRTRVVITDPNGQPIDEVIIPCTVNADVFHPAVGMRVAECGRMTGFRAARYVRKRLGF